VDAERAKTRGDEPQAQAAAGGGAVLLDLCARSVGDFELPRIPDSVACESGEQERREPEQSDRSDHPLCARFAGYGCRGWRLLQGDLGSGVIRARWFVVGRRF
jgi:hypothetical protein